MLLLALMIELLSGWKGQEKEEEKGRRTVLWRKIFQVMFCRTLRVRTHDQNFVRLIICNEIVTVLNINVLSCQVNVPPFHINDPPSQINVPSFWERIMTLGTFICKRVTYLCPFLTVCTGPKATLSGCRQIVQSEENDQSAASARWSLSPS